MNLSSCLSCHVGSRKRKTDYFSLRHRKRVATKKIITTDGVNRIPTAITTRGGVEDTRLEAKAKDTKKNPRPRPRTAFPRTEPLEAKVRNARGQGRGPRTQAQAFS